MNSFADVCISNVLTFADILLKIVTDAGYQNSCQIYLLFLSINGSDNKGDQLSRTFSQESQILNTNEDNTGRRQKDKNEEQSVFSVNILQFSYNG